MLRTLLTLLATTLSLLVVDIIFPGVRLANFPAALIAAVVIGLVNSGVKPIISTLSLPLNFVSLGSFSLVVNGICFWLASILVPGFRVGGLIAFILAPVLLSAVNTFLSQYFAERYPQLNSTSTNKELSGQ
jgi:putative membrane protein